jgi:hypothetical protein
MYEVDRSTAVMVCGGNVYKVTDAGVATNIGSVPDDGKMVQITGDGTNLVIAAGGSLYSVTLTGTVSTFIRSGISMVDFIDDHFIAAEDDSGNFVWSDVLTTSFPALNIQATNGAPDVMIGMKVARRTIYFFGSKSLEQWYDSGGVDNPFSRIDGAFFEVGCIAKNSIAEIDSVFWLGGDEKGAGTVWTVEGGSPKRISTPAIEFAINQWPNMSDAYAFTYAQEGHGFYVLSSVSGNETWAYDVTTNEWHQRAWLSPAGELDRIRPQCHLYFAGKHLVGDWQTGDVYEYDLDTYSDNGSAIPAIRTCGTLQSGLEQQGAVSFQLDMDTGVGITTGQGSDPQVMLRWSKNGGNTWSSELWRTAGKIGEYSRRCIWRRVGGGRRVVFEVKITDPVKRQITGAFIK